MYCYTSLSDLICEWFSIKCRHTEIKQIQLSLTTNKTTQSANKNAKEIHVTCNERGKTRLGLAFFFAFDWLRKWHSFFFLPITKRDKAKEWQNRIALDIIENRSHWNADIVISRGKVIFVNPFSRRKDWFTSHITEKKIIPNNALLGRRNEKNNNNIPFQFLITCRKKCLSGNQ